MSQSIPAGLKKEHILSALAELDKGLDHNFGTPTGYLLVHNQKNYAPKTVIGLACRYSIGRILNPNEFSGGESSGQANFVLRKLGFEVIKKPEGITLPKPEKPWSKTELAILVSDYFLMLEAELTGTTYESKVPVQLFKRPKDLVNAQRQNISSLLIKMGLPYLEKFEPISTDFGLLSEEIDLFIDKKPEFFENLAKVPLLNPKRGVAFEIKKPEELFEAPPLKSLLINPISKPWLSRKGRLTDFAERDALNRSLGMVGEEFVYELERHRLTELGRDDLANKVQWASKDIGDGLGFDIISYDGHDESERMLEVKATGLGKYSPFWVSQNELRCSQDIPSQYELFRVFNFSRCPKIYVLHGSLAESCQLEPVLFRARV